VLPRVSAAAMGTFLAEFAQTIPEDMHAVMVLDQAGWHDVRALSLPEPITLVPLPAYSPELNPVERVWLYLRERYLSHRPLADCTGSWLITTPSWGPAAPPGRRSQPKSAASARSPHTPTSIRSVLKAEV